MPPICITGCAGFIGSQLSERLLGEGKAVLGVDSFDDYYAPEIKRNNLRDCLATKQFHLAEGDIRDGRFLEAIFRKHRPRIVVHLAARAGVRPSMEKPLLYEQVNVGGTVQILEVYRQTGVEKFIFGSSSSVYGSSPDVPFSEERTRPEPISPYGATKLAGEAMCDTYHRLYGLSVTNLRFFTVYGPRQRPEMAIHKFARLLTEGKAVPRFGDGTTARDYTFIDDIVDGIVASLALPAGCETFNLGNSQPISLTGLINLVAVQLG
ncbi:MAG: NAD-dependent epimerase/dehydratase family protein, partial [Acidobacteriota bacterium]